MHREIPMLKLWSKKFKINIMKTFYNSIAIILIVLWGVAFFVSNTGSFIHLLLLPIAAILVYDFVGIIKLLNKA
ncbi:lmo0937 family membrane protein [Flavobacterium sp.]|uniref:lmo0937 family membrane protein n=1 Tax=Flavobacterium sp. TaxID=239 RepID=UPI002D7E7695|nr:lmo0937 family membrane protein [Flavobacterium sp.]